MLNDFKYKISFMLHYERTVYVYDHIYTLLQERFHRSSFKAQHKRRLPLPHAMSSYAMLKHNGIRRVMKKRDASVLV